MNSEQALESHVSDDEQLLESLVDSYLDQFQTGVEPDPQALLGHRLDLAERFERRLAVVKALCSLAPQRPASRSLDCDFEITPDGSVLPRALSPRAAAQAGESECPGPSEAGVQGRASRELAQCQVSGASHVESGSDAGRSCPHDWEATSVAVLSPPLKDDELGRLGRYSVMGALGAGAMGCVYKARHPMMDRVVAIKVIAPRLTSDPHAIERFEREVKAAARLHHPHIVAAFDADHSGATYFLVMEYVEGTDLAKFLATNGPLDSAMAAECLLQIAFGLQHAHEQGMVHRDLKPSNLMITRQGTVKILDFGLARIAEASPLSEFESLPSGFPSDHGLKSVSKDFDTEASPSLSTADEVPIRSSTRTHTVLGTPDYISPEQACDPRTADERSDIYSLGATFYHLLSGRVPFPGACSLEKIDRRQIADPQPIREIVANIDPRLAKIITRMMARNRDERFQNAAGLIEELKTLDFPRANEHPAQRRWLSKNTDSKAKSPELPGSFSVKGARFAVSCVRYFLQTKQPNRHWAFVAATLVLVAIPMATSGLSWRREGVRHADPARVELQRDVALESDIPSFVHVRPFLDLEFDQPALSPYFHELENDQLKTFYDQGRFIFRTKTYPPEEKYMHFRAEHLPGRMHDFACEFNVRITGTKDDSLLVAITNQSNDNRAVQINLAGDASLTVGTATWDPEPNLAPKRGPIFHPAIRRDEFNRLVVILCERELRLFVNGEEVCETIALGRDVTPAVVAVGISTAHGHSQVEFDRIRSWKVRGRGGSLESLANSF